MRVSILPHLLQIIGETGTVQSVTDSGDIRVRYQSGMVWTLNADVATKVRTCRVPGPCTLLIVGRISAFSHFKPEMTLQANTEVCRLVEGRVKLSLHSRTIVSWLSV
jgi:hypothetical protein